MTGEGGGERTLREEGHICNENVWLHPSPLGYRDLNHHPFRLDLESSRNISSVLPGGQGCISSVSGTLPFPW